MSITNIIIIIVAALIGALVSQIVFRRLKFIDLERTKEKSKAILAKATEEAEKIIQDTNDSKQEVEKNTAETVNQMKTLINTIEKNVKFKEEMLARKTNKNNQYQKFIEEVENELKNGEKSQREKEEHIKQRLAAKLGISVDDMAARLINDFKGKLDDESGERIAKKIDFVHETAEKQAKNIIRGALQKFTDRTSVEKKEAKIKVPKDSVKALIVGDDAKNILEFEKVLDVDVIFNDEPNTIVVSSFDLLKKNIARIALEKLVRLKKINETTIRDSIKSAKEILSKDLMVVGEKAVKKMGFKDKFPPDLIKIIGRLKYRTSYGQNILLHSFEVAYMAELLASELGLDAMKVKKAAFFHDIGKAIDQHIEGSSHDVLTKEIMTKFGFPEDEIHAAWTHHEAEPPETPEARLVMAADAISAGRPGARQESLEKYLERLRALEEIATSFNGVQKTFAISAGRELRVLVSPEDIKDEGMEELAENIADQVEDKLSYPGRIKINVIRRTRSTDYAK